jgi:hypothetical protein
MLPGAAAAAAAADAAAATDYDIHNVEKPLQLLRDADSSNCYKNIMNEQRRHWRRFRHRLPAFLGRTFQVIVGSDFNTDFWFFIE